MYDYNRDRKKDFMCSMCVFVFIFVCVQFRERECVSVSVRVSVWLCVYMSVCVLFWSETKR